MRSTRFFNMTCITLALLMLPHFLQAGWSRIYGGDDEDEGRCVRQTDDGGYIVLGTTTSFGAGGKDLWLTKTDAFGNTIWTRTFGDEDYDTALCLNLTADGGYIVSGTPGLIKTDALGEIEWQIPYTPTYVQQTQDKGYVLVAPSAYGVWLVKTDDQGDTMWTSTFRYGDGYCVQQTSDGGYVIAAELWTDTCETDVGVIKTDENGNELWTYTCGDISRDRGSFVQETSDGCYVVTGTINVSIVVARNSKLLLSKIDASGGGIWEYISAVELGSSSVCVQESSDSCFVVTGTVRSPLGKDTLRHPMLLRFGQSGGDPLWIRIFGDEQSAGEGKFVEQTSDGGYIVVGDWRSHEDTTASQYIWLIKTDSAGSIAVDEEPVAEHAVGFEVITPVGTEIVLRYENLPKGFHALVLDASGRKVDELHTCETSGSITWPVTVVTGGDAIPAGVYFIVPVSEGLSKAQKVVITR